MNDEIFDTWRETVAKTAAFVTRDFPDIEEEEVRQELWLFVCENHKKLQTPDKGGSVKALIRCANNFCWEQRKQQLHITSQYSYRTSDVRKILETVFDYSQWDRTKVPDDARSEFNDVFMEVAADVKASYDKLPTQYQQIIYVRYALGETLRTSAERERLKRAIARLCDYLNYYRGKPVDHEYIGSRRVISNGAASATIRHQYSE
jgi:DNA-directed RNA polymerase specialized sigma24 family protein